MKKLTLVRDSGTWKVLEADNFPALSTKVQTTLDKIAALKKSFPVATTEIAARQLKAASTEFEKKLVVSQGDKNVTFFLGTSPTFKKVHIRVEDDPNTYAADFSSYDLSTSTADWLNKSLFAVARDKIKKVKSGDIELKLDNNNPALEGVEDQQETDVEKANSFLSKITALEFTDLATADQKKKIQDKKPVYELSVEKNDNTIDTLQFFEGDTADDVFLKLTSQPFYVKVAKNTYEDIKKATKSSLIKTKKPAEAAKVDSSAPSSPPPVAAAPVPPPDAVPAMPEMESEDGQMSVMPEIPLPDESAEGADIESESPNENAQ